MTDALNNPVKRTYNRKETSTADFQMPSHEADFDNRGEGFADVVGDILHANDQIENLAFAEEPITIMIQSMERKKLPVAEYVPCFIQGKGAEYMYQGKMRSFGWLPTKQPVTTRRKYAEALIRSKENSVQTVHQDASVQSPINTQTLESYAPYMISVLRDDNPKGGEWLSQLVQNH